MRTIRHIVGGTGAALLVTSLAFGGGAVAPAHAAAVPLTSRAAIALLTVTPTTTNRGGVVMVSGSGFQPNEMVTLALSGMTGPAAIAKADAKGLLPATGISIPFSLNPGSYTISATGAASKRVGSTAITVAKLTPSIAISAPSAAPGATETVTGKGFGTKEQITLSLNGEALPSSPAVITTTNGAFTAMIKAPSSLLGGANAIGALGNESRVSAVVPLTGLLTRAAQFYFAGAINTARDHSYVELLNPNQQPASARLTFYFDNGSNYTRLVNVAASSENRVSVAALGNLPEGTYGLQVKADRPIAAQISTIRDGMDGDILLGRAAPDTRWYLAAGSTSGTFQEHISILNPDSALPAHLQLQLIGANGQVKTVTVTAAAHTNAVVNVNSLMPNQVVSVIASADRPVVVERTLTFGPGGRGLTTRDGSNRAALNWLFADATTENGVQTIFTILNPNAYAVQTTASFSRGSGVVLGTRTVYIPALGRATINTKDVVQGGGLAVAVTGGLPIVVERSEYIGAPDKALAGSVVAGRNGAATRWTFAGGNTTAPNNEVLDLYNPSAVTTPITATFYTSTGHMLSKQYTLAPTARLIISLNSLGLTELHGAILESGNGQGFIAEQGISRRDSLFLSASQGLAQ